MTERVKDKEASIVRRYIEAVRQFAELALDKARDRYGKEATPLFADGIHSRTYEPVRWLSQGQSWTLSNLANQQNWLRTLDGLSELTGEARYREAAEAAVRYALDELRYGKLLYWGGHMAFDLESKQPVHAADKGPQHELKCHYPYYELMNRVNPEETARYIEALWAGHITDWSNLEFSRHGQPVRDLREQDVWEQDYAEDSPVFFTGRGLTFINAGSDLFYAAAMYHRFFGEEKPLQWAKRLAHRYVETRNPETGLGGYQFSISVLPGQRGDRAVDQFGEQLKEHAPIEATLTTARQAHTIIGEAALCRMSLAETLGTSGREFLDWAVEDLLAYGEYAYDPFDHSFHPMLTNGTRLTGLVMEKSGYYGRAGEQLKAAQADVLLLWSYVKAYRLSGNAKLWTLARSIGGGLGFGDIGTPEGGATDLPSELQTADPVAIFALLELFETTGQRKFLQLAQRVGDRIVLYRFHRGLFMPSPDHEYAKLDALEPLALLHLAAAMLGVRGRMPAYCGGRPFFAAAYDGLGHQTDNILLYQKNLPSSPLAESL
ncbi:hypothetical protein N0M98_25715 [Paenibacillus doosanensis]|uniref:hypothetical protein n=1 Tax=Paenibacillus doosanensis TaxID=1229154 RepID=UPI00218057A4|nr:hypothetical protein [Paenibacillus doosanensis]MCS7463509.1 hypothetical protein [Paenibacillus doosanensis]